MDSKKINEQFELLYKSKIERSIAPLEEERKKVEKIVGIFIILDVFSLVILILIGALFKESGFVSYAMLLFMFSVVLSVIIPIPYQRKYRSELKSKLLMPILSIFGKFYYVNNSAISLQEIQSYGLFRGRRLKKDDDVIVGKYKDLEISITETRIYHSHSSGKSRTEITDFSGLILKIKMNKNFEGHTLVRQKPMSYEQFLNNMKFFREKNGDLIPAKFMSMIESPVIKFLFKSAQFADQHSISISTDGGLDVDLLKNMKKKPGKLEQVKLEDSEFNNIFEIFSDNQVEARYLLTPSFMERLKMISMVMLVMQVHCVFKDGYITLFLGNPIMLDQTSDRGFFELEPGYKETLYNKEVYKRVFIELLTIFDFIHHFKLDQKIGL